jgi:hypothetical protein
VAGDGTILRGLPVEAHLPSVEVDGGVGVDRLREGFARDAVAIAGAAPAVLRARIVGVDDEGKRGLVAELREGPDLIFGDATRLAAKWAAAARVLADLEANGASYIDLRLPDRPAAGGLPAETVAPVAPAGTTSRIPPVTAAGAPTTAGATATDPYAVDPYAGTAPTAATPPAADPYATDPTATTPPATGTTPPASATAPPTGATAPPATSPVAPAPVTGGTGGGATAAPSP